jgi:hypothetical protein
LHWYSSSENIVKWSRYPCFGCVVKKPLYFEWIDQDWVWIQIDSLSLINNKLFRETKRMSVTSRALSIQATLAIGGAKAVFFPLINRSHNWLRPSSSHRVTGWIWHLLWVLVSDRCGWTPKVVAEDSTVCMKELAGVNGAKSKSSTSASGFRWFGWEQIRWGSCGPINLSFGSKSVVLQFRHQP